MPLMVIVVILLWAAYSVLGAVIGDVVKNRVKCSMENRKDAY